MKANEEMRKKLVALEMVVQCADRLEDMKRWWCEEQEDGTIVPYNDEAADRIKVIDAVIATIRKEYKL